MQRIEAVATLVGCACLMAVMLVVTADVGFRYLLNTPFIWSYDVITLYLTPAVFFLTLSNAYAAGAQVNIDLLHAAMPTPLRRIANAISAAASLCAFGLIAYGGALRLADSWENSDVLAGVIPWPTWPSILLVPVGCSMLALRLITSLVINITGETTSPPASADHPTIAGHFE